MNRIISLCILIIAVIGIGFYYYLSVYPEQLESAIYQQKGYEVHKVDEVTISFELGKNWLDVPKEETKVINEVLKKKFNSILYLESVRNSSKHSLTFNIQQDFNSKSGKFLSHLNIADKTGQVSFISKREIINLYDQEEQLIDSMTSRGSGPRELFSSDYSLSLLEKVKLIEINLNVYEYKKF